MKRIQVPAVMVTGLTTEKVENVRIVLLTTVKAGIARIARDLMPIMKEVNARSVRMVTALMAIVLNVLLTIVKVAIVRIVLASITITKEANARSVLTTAKVVLMIVLNVLPTIVKVVLMTVLNVPVSIAAKVVIVLNVLLTTVKVVTVRIVPVLITAKVAAIAAITAVGEVTVRDTTMTVHKEDIVLVRVPAIMIRTLSIA